MDSRELEIIDNIINNFTETHFGVCASMDTDFFYDPEEDDITYAFVVSEVNDKMFMNCVHSIEPNLNCDIFLLSLLHEVGHHFTWEDLTAEEQAYTPDGEEYYYSPKEIVATKWAVDYIYNNTNLVKAFWEELQPHILQFYRDNNVED